LYNKTECRNETEKIKNWVQTSYRLVMIFHHSATLSSNFPSHKAAEMIGLSSVSAVWRCGRKSRIE